MNFNLEEETEKVKPETKKAEPVKIEPSLETAIKASYNAGMEALEKAEYGVGLEALEKEDYKYAVGKFEEFWSHFDETRADYRTENVADINTRSAVFNFARALSGAGDDIRAIATFRQCLDVDVGDSGIDDLGIHRNIAVCYEHLGVEKLIKDHQVEYLLASE